jgi:hypothetical protein
MTVLETPTLIRRALVAGAGNLPLQDAAVLALSGEGQLLIPESNGLWQISPDRFEVSNIKPGQNPALVGELAVRSSDGTILMLEPSRQMLRALR